MQIPVFVEHLPAGGGFRARAGEPFPIIAESADRSQAIEDVQRRLERLVRSGDLVSVSVGTSDPMAELIGTIDMKDQEYQKWWNYVEEFRREMDHTRLADEPDEIAE